MKKIYIALTTCIALGITGCIDMKDNSLRTNPNDPLNFNNVFADYFSRPNGSVENGWLGDLAFCMLANNHMEFAPTAAMSKYIHHTFTAGVYTYAKFTITLGPTCDGTITVKLGSAANPDMLCVKASKAALPTDLYIGSGDNPPGWVMALSTSTPYVVELSSINCAAGTATLTVNGTVKGQYSFSPGPQFDKVTVYSWINNVGHQLDDIVIRK